MHEAHCSSWFMVLHGDEKRERKSVKQVASVVFRAGSHGWFSEGGIWTMPALNSPAPALLGYLPSKGITLFQLSTHNHLFSSKKELVLRLKILERKLMLLCLLV